MRGGGIERRGPSSATRAFICFWKRVGEEEKAGGQGGQEEPSRREEWNCWGKRGEDMSTRGV